MILQKAKCLGLVVCVGVAFFSSPEATLGWGSVESWYATGVEGTHKFILRQAYRILEKDPAYRKGAFPSLDAVLSHEGINKSLSGYGPDGEGNSIYDEHFYNPQIGKGAAPRSIAGWFEKTVRACAAGKPLAGAKGAAYGAHYLGDMCVPYHVNGAPYWTTLKLYLEQDGFNAKQVILTENYYGTLDLRYGYRNTKAGIANFRKEIEKYLFKTASTEVNWFDPWLGDSLFDTSTSHVMWEIEAYACHTPIWDNAVTQHPLLKDPAYERGFKNASVNSFDEPWKPQSIQTAELAKYCAGRTTKLLPYFVENPTPAIARSIIAVATIWRASISALRPGLTITEAPDASGAFEISGDVSNVADGTADKLRVRMTVISPADKIVVTQEREIGRISANGYKTIADVWRVKPPSPGCRVRLEATALYDKIPDLQYAVQELPLQSTTMRYEGVVKWDERRMYTWPADSGKRPLNLSFSEPDRRTIIELLPPDRRGERQLTMTHWIRHEIDYPFQSFRDPDGGTMQMPDMSRDPLVKTFDPPKKQVKYGTYDSNGTFHILHWGASISGAFDETECSGKFHKRRPFDPDGSGIDYFRDAKATFTLKRVEAKP
jgi:hypothetical protein